METIGILYSYKGGSPRVDGRIESRLHMNYWKLDDKNRFIDFGLMISGNYEILKSIWFFFPFQIDACDVSDLGHVISNVEMLNTLFNADYTIENEPKSSYCRVTSNPNEEDKSFLLYKLGDNNFRVSSELWNQVLEISINSAPSRDKGGIKPQDSSYVQNNDPNSLTVYLRFRVKLHGACFYRQETITNDVFQSAFSKSEVLYMRINDKRDIDYSKLEQLSAGREWFDFKKIHFFYCGPTNEEQILGSKPYEDCRLFDSTQWDLYMEGFPKKKTKYVAFHWSTSSDNKPIKTYNLFVKTLFQRTNFLKLFIYSSVLIILGALGSLLANLIK